MIGKTMRVWDAPVAAYGTASISDYDAFGERMKGTAAYTRREGGDWIEDRPSRINSNTQVHAIRMKDGRVWDVVNGWRKSSKPTLADDISFKPSTRRILAHLKARGSITVLEALAAYGTARIAPAIHDLREGGYSIETVKKADAGGHNYTRYVLAA
jgi:hypothetical protein